LRESLLLINPQLQQELFLAFTAKYLSILPSGSLSKVWFLLKVFFFSLKNATRGSLGNVKPSWSIHFWFLIKSFIVMRVCVLPGSFRGMTFR